MAEVGWDVPCLNGSCTMCESTSKPDAPESIANAGARSNERDWEGWD